MPPILKDLESYFRSIFMQCSGNTSNITAMPEIAEDAAILVSPYHIDEIKCYDRNFTNDKLRLALIEKGKNNYKVLLGHYSISTVAFNSRS